MERIFGNLYRITHEPYSEVTVDRYHYSYLLIRRQGNLFIGHCQAGSNVREHLDEIEQLGGVAEQVITHYFDANKECNDVLYDRFSCRLHYHQDSRKILRAKTQCPETEFGDEGLRIGSDFKALYFPGQRPGRTILWWKSRGKGFLFTGYSIHLARGEWRIDFDPYFKPHLAAQFAELPKMQVDFAMPTRSSFGEEQFHRFTDATRKSFVEALTINTMTPADTFALLQKADELTNENEALKVEIRSLQRRIS